MSDPGNKVGVVTLRYQKPDGTWTVEYRQGLPDSANPYLKKVLARERRAKPRAKAKDRKRS